MLLTIIHLVIRKFDASFPFSQKRQVESFDPKAPLRARVVGECHRQLRPTLFFTAKCGKPTR